MISNIYYLFKFNYHLRNCTQRIGYDPDDPIHDGFESIYTRDRKLFIEVYDGRQIMFYSKKSAPSVGMLYHRFDGAYNITNEDKEYLVPTNDLTFENYVDTRTKIKALYKKQINALKKELK